ncbi:hypothetical protein WHI96_05610 [Pseudonocardia tropica]|uniref:Integrase n=1 Tax=Pseudonocardia tropica TaxID=681289 RepID=A0ABV1JQS8_9PSEU
MPVPRPRRQDPADRTQWGDEGRRVPRAPGRDPDPVAQRRDRAPRPEHTFERAAELWLVELDAQVADGARAVTTADLYRRLV